MKYDFIDYNFIKTIIAVFTGAIIPVIANLLLEKTKLTNDKKKLKYEKNLNTLRKLKVNHLTLVNLINDFYKINHFIATNEPNLLDKLYNTSLENTKLNYELLDIEINNISELHSNICRFLNNLSSNIKNENDTIQKLNNLSETITKDILETIKNIDK